MATGSAGLSCAGFIRPGAAAVNSALRPASAPAAWPSARERIGPVSIGADGAAQAAQLDEGPDADGEGRQPEDAGNHDGILHDGADHDAGGHQKPGTI